MGKIGFIISKEFRHILRDPRSLIIAILLPILMTLLYGYAIRLDTKNIKLAVLDFDRSTESRELASKFYRSGYFLPSLSEPDIIDPEEVLRASRAHAVLVLRPGFSEALRDPRRYELGILIDGADNNRAAAASNYSNAIVQEFLRERFPPAVRMPRVVLSRQVLYNPDLESSHFFVPGLIAIILMMISALLTSITIAREKETGTMELFLTSPVSPREIIAGKVIPYIGLAMLDGLLVLLFALILFKVPFSGSGLLLLVVGVIYVAAALSLGILISTLVKTQQVAMMFALMATVLPSVILSGFIFEIKNMPLPLQYFSYLIPARHFILIIRGIMLKGATFAVLWKEVAVLVLIAAALLTAASKKFKLTLG